MDGPGNQNPNDPPQKNKCSNVQVFKWLAGGGCPQPPRGLPAGERAHRAGAGGDGGGGARREGDPHGGGPPGACPTGAAVQQTDPGGWMAGTFEHTALATF